MDDSLLSIAAVQACRDRLGDHVLTTPIHRWRGHRLAAAFRADVETLIKLELFQLTGSFKPRGAINVILSMTPDELRRAVTSASGGNHAIATAYAARVAGAPAKVVMPRNASPLRVAMAQACGAEVVLVEQPSRWPRQSGAKRARPSCIRRPADRPGRGDGGLCGGMACAMKQLQPSCRAIGVAASTAALIGPLRGPFNGLCVGVIGCGANIDAAAFGAHLAAAARLESLETFAR